MIRFILNLYLVVVLVDVILCYIPQLQNEQLVKKIHMISDFSLAPIRKYIVQRIFPTGLAFDISPVILLLAVKIVEALW